MVQALNQESTLPLPSNMSVAFQVPALAEVLQQAGGKQGAAEEFWGKCRRVAESYSKPPPIPMHPEAAHFIQTLKWTL